MENNTALGISKLLKLQNELKAPKDKTNSYGGYKYRSAESILEALKPLLVKVGAVIVIRDSIEQFGNRYYVCATVYLIDAEDGNIITTSTAYAREAETKKGMDESQITGTASSYARKYRLNGMFAIDDTRDADTDEYVEQTTTADEDEYECSVCHKKMPKKWYEQSIEKYGSPYCSTACKEKGEAEK